MPVKRDRIELKHTIMKKLIPFFILTFVISQMTFSQEYGWTDISANIPGNPNLSDVYFVSDNEGWITSN